MRAAVLGKKNWMAWGKYALKMSFHGESKSALGKFIKSCKTNTIALIVSENWLKRLKNRIVIEDAIAIPTPVAYSAQTLVAHPPQTTPSDSLVLPPASQLGKSPPADPQDSLTIPTSRHYPDTSASFPVAVVDYLMQTVTQPQNLDKSSQTSPSVPV
jgi:hypothetical protein